MALTRSYGVPAHPPRQFLPRSAGAASLDGSGVAGSAASVFGEAFTCGRASQPWRISPSFHFIIHVVSFMWNSSIHVLFRNDVFPFSRSASGILDKEEIILIKSLSAGEKRSEAVCAAAEASDAD